MATELFTQFGPWLLQRSGAHKAALSINTHYRFFLAIDSRWSAMPSYEQLLQHFGAAGLRKAENPMRWLTETGAVTVSKQVRDEHIEQSRIDALLAEAADSWSAQLLGEYATTLMARVARNETDLRSVRLSTRAALNLLTSSHLKLGEMPTQKALESFWRGSPGQVAAVTGFVGHLNKRHHLSLKAKPDMRWLAQAKQQKAERALVAMLGQTETEEFETRWIVKGLAYFHGVRANRKTLVFHPHEYRGVAGYNVTLQDSVLWVPTATSYQHDESLESG